MKRNLSFHIDGDNICLLININWLKISHKKYFWHNFLQPLMEYANENSLKSSERFFWSFCFLSELTPLLFRNLLSAFHENVHALASHCFKSMPYWRPDFHFFYSFFFFFSIYSINFIAWVITDLGWLKNIFMSKLLTLSKIAVFGCFMANQPL